MFEILKKTTLFISFLLSGCVTLPENITPVEGFRIDRYLGLWYEIARLDHSFERGLENVTATYSYRKDGGIRVVNRGFDPERKRWKEAMGKAYFVGAPDIGRLKVSFFGPFYGGYNIIALDKENYAYALVCGPNKSYLWILAREPHLPESVKSELIRTAAALGFETDNLIHVNQQPVRFQPRT